MERLETRLDGLVLIAPDVRRDDRGFFLETFQARRYAEIGVDTSFVQDNHSRSTRGTLRGLHFQLGLGQAKLVSVARGAAFDVVVDIRPRSPTFGEWESFDLDDRRHLQLFIPRGFAHGFCVLADEVDFTYKVDSYYDPNLESGIAWNDPAIGIDWPVREPFTSNRDQRNPTLSEIAASLPDWE
jgi:dTDP-4-dehydrorhamnose 3,5-epimerase